MRFLFWTLPLTLIRLSFYLAVFLTPLVGVWLASSLVAYVNGPPLLAVFSGILLFPLIPILWDWSRRPRRKKSAAILTWGDRITLRTLALNVAFLVLLVGLQPQTTFLAISTRGDWFLDGHQGPTVQLARQGLFYSAQGLEWLYRALNPNPFNQYQDQTAIQPTPRPAPGSRVDPGISSAPVISDSTAPTPVDTQWPWRGNDLHPAVAQMPASVETSIESVAQYIASQESDPILRVKALHDYVADRVAYDAESYFAGQYPPQDAETVFRTRKAVCAGYAKLLEALGQAIGEEIYYVTGNSRSSSNDLSGAGHAWNGIKIGEYWYLMDPTWDSGYVSREEGFTKNYRLSYFLPPPAVMAITHFPENPGWQLLEQPLTLGDFLRQPVLRPDFFAHGLELNQPTRSQTDTGSVATITVNNPQQTWLSATYALKGGSEMGSCENSFTPGPTLHCELPSPGTYEVRLFAGEDEGEPLSYVGHLEFNRR